MKANLLIEMLKEMSKEHDVKLSELEVNFRVDFDSDVKDINYVIEDLFDEETNSILESVVLCTEVEQ